MNARLRFLFRTVLSSFWFVPGSMLISALALSWITATIDLGLDFSIDSEAKEWNIWIGPAGARTLLNTIAGSMITVASLVFSMTIIALTMAASNLGPRVINYFIADRVTQVSLGLFLATFVYAMMILLVIRDGDDQSFVPYVSLAVAVTLAVLCFAWLIYFIHRVAHSIQADTVVAKISDELKGAITDVLNEIDEDDDPDSSSERNDSNFPSDVRLVRSDSTGYIQVVSHENLAEKCAERGVRIRLLHRAGHFVVAGEAIAEIADFSSDGNGEESKEDDRDRESISSVIRDAVVTGEKRTLGQDVEFAVSQLVEVGVRALSPGINDFNTAIVTIDRLTGALADAFKRGLPLSTLQDEDGEIRVWLSSITYAGLVENAFNEIRQCARGNVAVSIRLMEGLERLGRISRTDAQGEALQRQIDSLMAAARSAIDDGPDLEDMEDRYKRFRNTLPKMN